MLRGTIKTTSPGIFASNVYGDTLLTTSLNVSGITKLINIPTLFSPLNVSGFTSFNNNVTLVSSFNVSGFSTFSNNPTFIIII